MEARTITALEPWLEHSVQAFEVAVRVMFTRNVLATWPASDVATHWLLSRQRERIIEEQRRQGLSPVEAEQAAERLLAAEFDVPEGMEDPVGLTVFPRLGNKPVVLDYQWRGFFKEALEALRLTRPGRRKERVLLHRGDVALYLHVVPEAIVFVREDGREVTEDEIVLFSRPVQRRQYGAGATSAIKTSEMLIASAEKPLYQEFVIRALRPVDGHIWRPHDVAQLLAFGEHYGFQGWRGGGFGRFTVLRFDVTGWEE